MSNYKSHYLGNTCGRVNSKLAVIHSVEPQNPQSGGPHLVSALCGAKPGRKSYGWVERFESIVNCEKCIRLSLKDGEL